MGANSNGSASARLLQLYCEIYDTAFLDIFPGFHVFDIMDVGNIRVVSVQIPQCFAEVSLTCIWLAGANVPAVYMA